MEPPLIGVMAAARLATSIAAAPVAAASTTAFSVTASPALGLRDATAIATLALTAAAVLGGIQECNLGGIVRNGLVELVGIMVPDIRFRIRDLAGGVPHPVRKTGHPRLLRGIKRILLDDLIRLRQLHDVLTEREATILFSPEESPILRIGAHSPIGQQEPLVVGAVALAVRDEVEPRLPAVLRVVVLANQGVRDRSQAALLKFGPYARVVTPIRHPRVGDLIGALEAAVGRPFVRRHWGTDDIIQRVVCRSGNRPEHRLELLLPVPPFHLRFDLADLDVDVVGLLVGLGGKVLFDGVVHRVDREHGRVDRL